MARWTSWGLGRSSCQRTGSFKGAVCPLTLATFGCRILLRRGRPLFDILFFALSSFYVIPAAGVFLWESSGASWVITSGEPFLCIFSFLVSMDRRLRSSERWEGRRASIYHFSWMEWKGGPGSGPVLVGLVAEALPVHIFEHGKHQ